MMLAKQDRRLDGVQLLRALAAAMIVVVHAEGIVGRHVAARGLSFRPIPGVSFEAGVDLFFVISGFIIVYASERFFAAPGGGTEFLRRRLCRIVPLYWFALTLRLLMLSSMAAAGLAILPSPAAVATSFAFIPYDAMGYGPRFPFPILDLGWTLNYEMLFYVLFTFVIWMPRRAAGLTAVAILCAGVLIAWVHPPESVPLRFWSQPIVLEFALGICVALLFRRGVRLPAFARAGLVALGLSTWLFLDVGRFDPTAGSVPGLYGWPRCLIYGGSAALVLAGTVLGGAEVRSRLLRTLSRLGESSYALYLLHVFIIHAIWLAAKSLPLTEAMLWPLAVMSVLVAIAGAHAFHRLIERPVVDRLLRSTSRLAPSRWGDTPRRAREPFPNVDMPVALDAGRLLLDETGRVSAEGVTGRSR